jgi:hypothetical protein
VSAPPPTATAGNHLHVAPEAEVHAAGLRAQRSAIAVAEAGAVQRGFAAQAQALRHTQVQIAAASGAHAGGLQIGPLRQVGLTRTERQLAARRRGARQRLDVGATEHLQLVGQTDGQVAAGAAAALTRLAEQCRASAHEQAAGVQLQRTGILRTGRHRADPHARADAHAAVQVLGQRGLQGQLRGTAADGHQAQAATGHRALARQQQVAAAQAERRTIGPQQLCVSQHLQRRGALGAQEAEGLGRRRAERAVGLRGVERLAAGKAQARRGAGVKGPRHVDARAVAEHHPGRVDEEEGRRAAGRLQAQQALQLRDLAAGDPRDDVVQRRRLRREGGRLAAGEAEALEAVEQIAARQPPERLGDQVLGPLQHDGLAVVRAGVGDDAGDALRRGRHGQQGGAHQQQQRRACRDGPRAVFHRQFPISAKGAQ